MKRDWLWDRDIDEKKVKSALSNINNSQFISYSALILSRKNSAKEVFNEFIKREDFFVCWVKIKKQMRKNAWNDPRIEYWQAIYDTLKEEMPELKEIKQPHFDEPLFSISREIGIKIKEARKQSGLTQKRLAEKLGFAQQIISRIESGKQNISIETLDNICQALGIPLNVEKLGLKSVGKPQEMSTKHKLPFGQLSPEQFEELCYWIIERDNLFDAVEHYGGMGDKQRDIIGYKYNTVGKREKWYFQCKRYKNISFVNFKKELNQIQIHIDQDEEFKPDAIVFVTGCSVSPSCKDDVKEYAQKLSLSPVYFWTDIELNEKAKSTGADKHFFNVGITLEDLQESSQDLKRYLTNLFGQSGLISENDPSKKDEVNKSIDEAATYIKINNYEKAKQDLFVIKGKIEDEPKQYIDELARIYNNLGVCFNVSEADGGDFDEAEKYFHFALSIKPDFFKAKINLVSVYLNKAGKKNLKKAYDVANSLWETSDIKDSVCFQAFIWAKFHYQSPEEAITYYENSKEAQSLVTQNEQLLNLVGTIYLYEKNYEKAEEFANLAISLSPNTPHNVMLKARAFMERAQTKDMIYSDFDMVPRFKNYDNVKKALDLLEQSLEMARNDDNDFLINQLKYDMHVCLAWLRQYEGAQYKEARESIDTEILDPTQKRQLSIDDILIQIEKRNFEISYEMLISSEEWMKVQYKEKVRIAYFFFLRGAPEQSNYILKQLEEEAKKKRDVLLWIDISLNEVLLDNKIAAIQAACRAKEYSNGTTVEKSTLSHYNALMLRYAHSNEVDRLMSGLFEYNKKYPEDKVVWPIKAIEENGELSDEFRSMILKQRDWYGGIKAIFLSKPIPSYYLENLLKKPYAEILSFRDDVDFTIRLTQPNVLFEKELVSNLQMADYLVFDYASLLNISKMNLLGYLGKLGKYIYVSEELFKKIQYELLLYEQEDLRNLWRYLRGSKETHIIGNMQSSPKNKKYLESLDKWFVDSLQLAKDKNAVFVVDDLCLLMFSKTEENLKVCNSFIILKSMLAREWIDTKVYSTSVGDLAERFYTFLPFTGDDLFEIVMEDKSKLTLRSYHLVNQMFLPGSIAASFTNIFVRFIDLLWKTGSLPEDKIDWINYLSESILKLLDQQGGIHDKKELDKVVPDFVRMWTIAIQRSNKNEINLLEKKVDTLFVNNSYKTFKENLLQFMKMKRETL